MTTKTTNRNRIAVAWAVVMIAAVMPGVSQAAGETEVDPHWNKATCQTCHVGGSPTAENSDLQAADAEQLCEGCHGSRAGALPCRHSSGIPAADHRMPDSYREALKDGQLVCTTCHDLVAQCLAPHKSYGLANPGFIRDRKTRNRGEHCFECHNAAGYEQLDPHTMEGGDPALPTCTFCHASMPVKDDRGWLSVDFNMSGSRNDMCRGCHKVQPHPGGMFSNEPIGWDHLAVPSAEILENMKQAEERLGFVFPLDPSNGEIYCATCHNPHDEALEGYPVAARPGTDYRLRVDNNCQACHDL